MLKTSHPKHPMRERTITSDYKVEKLGFTEFGKSNYPDYLMVEKDKIQLHFFLFKELDPKENYGQVYYRTDQIDNLYRSFVEMGIEIHPNVHLSDRPWGQREFHLLDPDHNLLTFGQSV